MRERVLFGNRIFGVGLWMRSVKFSLKKFEFN